VRQNQERGKKKLNLPVLALGAEHATANASLEGMKLIATDLRGAIIPDCGHFVPEESPDLLHEHLIPFLEASARQEVQVQAANRK
jgi:pimeloyl-ACP methyl ester carboxylesterase